ncbi:hypothetical protein Ddc_02433 [Ditylenchus destructor]|nr:hypothetical protein Ddc_02433 [Ditylenchus destructor]
MLIKSISTHSHSLVSAELNVYCGSSWASIQDGHPSVHLNDEMLAPLKNLHKIQRLSIYDAQITDSTLIDICTSNANTLKELQIVAINYLSDFPVLQENAFIPIIERCECYTYTGTTTTVTVSVTIGITAANP